MNFIHQSNLNSPIFKTFVSFIDWVSIEFQFQTVPELTAGFDTRQDPVQDGPVGISV